MRTTVLFSAFTALLAANTIVAAPPVILSLQTNHALTWTSDYTNGVAIIERSTNLQNGFWLPFFYDFTMLTRTSRYDPPYFMEIPVPTRTTRLPQSQDSNGFYRIAIQTNPPDPSLKMHLSFDNDFVSNRVVLDISGHNNHGFAYGRPGYPTNWPSLTTGPDGSQAAEFHVYADGWGEYDHSGDYVGIPTFSDFLNMPQATVAFWCHYYPFTASGCDCNSTPLQAGMGIGAWTIGRFYDTQTTLEVQISEASAPIALSFPDRAPGGDTGGWHHYAFTFNQGLVKGYFDGTNFASAVVGVSALSVFGNYLSVAGWTFNETPWMDDLPSKHPNNAWINGALDDIRIYNRALAPAEILNLFTRVDKQAPAPPSNLRAKVDASSQIELDWSAASDNFRVDGYQILRNDIVIANVPGRRYVDTGLAAQTTYSYAVRAYDAAGNLSPLSSAVVTNTPIAGSPVEVIVDDAYGAPWLTTLGTWVSDSVNAPNFWETSFLKGTQNNGAVSVTFRPTLPEAGDYQVYIWNPGASNYPMWVFAASIPVDIVHGGTTDTVTLNEQINYARWNYLGTYTFDAGTNGFVRIRTTGTGGDLVLADALRFVK